MNWGLNGRQELVTQGAWKEYLDRGTDKGEEPEIELRKGTKFDAEWWVKERVPQSDAAEEAGQ